MAFSFDIQRPSKTVAATLSHLAFVFDKATSKFISAHGQGATPDECNSTEDHPEYIVRNGEELTQAEATAAIESTGITGAQYLAASRAIGVASVRKKFDITQQPEEPTP